MPLSPALCQEGRARPADITSPPAGQEERLLTGLRSCFKLQKKSKCPLPPRSALSASGERALRGSKARLRGGFGGEEQSRSTVTNLKREVPSRLGRRDAVSPPVRAGREAAGPSAGKDGGSPPLPPSSALHPPHCR